MNVPSEPDQPEPPQLRFLRRLVTTLMVVMIGGVLVIVALLVIRLSGGAPDQGAAITLPDSIALPEGVTAQAFTVGRGWYAVVTGDDRILIFDAGTGALRQSIDIETQP